MKERPKKPDYAHPEKWPELKWAVLESWQQQRCGCGEGCGDGKFSKDNPPEIAVRCHTGSPLWVAYWDGYLYLSCGECSKPIAKIKVTQSLL